MFQFSFLLPTRGRPHLVERFFHSIIDTADSIERIEVILCLDEDDLESQRISGGPLSVRKIVLPKGSTMGSLSRCGFETSSGRYVILINDDVMIRTKHWDGIVSKAFSVYQDDVALIHINDLLFRETLCTFPILSRKTCSEIGVCPAEYRKYRIDDHIYDTYQMLAYLGHKRILYLPDVAFEHDNKVRRHQTPAVRVFKIGENEISIPNKEIINLDGRTFLDKLEERKQNALKLASLIDQATFESKRSAYRVLLDRIKDPYGYRRKDFVKKVRWRKGDLQNIAPATLMEGPNRPNDNRDSISKSSLIKLLRLIQSNRRFFRIANRMTDVFVGVSNRYYTLPRSVRWATDGLISRLIWVYRAIQYGQKD